ncbi:MAG: tetratricopeptide repeat protein [Casimicrobiaceae bacterium]
MTPAAEWVARGRGHQQQSRPVDAMLCYRRAVRLDPSTADAHLHLGEVLWQLKRPDEAISAWREAVRLAPDQLRAHLALIEATLARAEFVAAEAAAATALARFPGVAPALLVAGIAALANDPQGDGVGHAAAIARVEEALELDSGLLKVPSLAGPLATVLDGLTDATARQRVAAKVIDVLTRSDVLAALPALLLALVIERVLVSTDASTDVDTLLRLAAERPYGASEHDPVRRMALAAARGRRSEAKRLAERYAAICVEAFGPSVPLPWPRRTGGSALRVLVLLQDDDLDETSGKAITALATRHSATLDVTLVLWPSTSTGDGATAPATRDAAVRTIRLPDGAALAEARQLAWLDADVLVDALGLRVPAGPLLATRPARAIWAIVDAPGYLPGPWVDDAPAMAALAPALRACHVGLPAELGTPGPEAMAVLFQEAVRLHQQHDYDAALRAYEDILELQPGHVPTLYLRAALRREGGDLDGALADNLAALEVAPRYVDARLAAAQAALDTHQPEVAIKIAARNIASAPGFTTLWRVLGLAHLARGEGEAAAELFEHALALELTDAETHYNHGVALQMQRRFGDAARAYQRALAFRPDFVAADFNLGVLFQEQGNHDAAIAAYGQVVRADPAHVNAYKNLGEVLFASGKLDAWRANFLRFEAACPQALPLAVQALEVCQHFADFEGVERYLDGLRNERYAARNPSELAESLEELLYLLLFFDVEPEILYRFAQTYNTTARSLYGAPMAREATRRPGRWRIGYLSADLRNHVMGKMMWAAIHHHDRDRFEVFCYSTSAEEDGWTQRFREGVDHFVSLASLRDAAAVERIAADDLDILVDLSTHTRGSRPAILARKPARVALTHVASAGAVGLAAIDFKLTDHFADVSENQAHVVEHLLPMAGCVYPYRHIPPAPVHVYQRERLGIPADAFVIGAFVTPMKLSRRCLRFWREVLERVPRARLAISPNRPSLQASFLRLADAAGISRERIVQIPQGKDEHDNQARYTVVDCVLDPLPFGGVNGSLEALDMGVPVVTLCGRKHGERTTYSILANLGVLDTVAHSGPDYVQLAVRLADDAAFAADVRAKIGRGLESSVLTDMPAHARNLEAAYLHALELGTPDAPRDP